MDALILRLTLLTITLFFSTGASYSTPNFAVSASSPDEARMVAEAAEEYRRRLAIYWTGQELPRWSRPCTVKVQSGALGAGGQTTFQFVGDGVQNWRMSVQGTIERILDSVLPHEVNHTIFACYFRRPLPRWADEGAATLFEHRSEQKLQLDLLQRVVRSGNGFIPLRRLLYMKQYPTGRRAMLTLYAEGFALVDFLMHQGGRSTYLEFLNEAHQNGSNWDAAIRQYYNHNGIAALEQDWRAWVEAGMPHYGESPDQMVALIGAQTRNVARPASHQRRQPATPVLSGRSARPGLASADRQRQDRGRGDGPLTTLEAPHPGRPGLGRLENTVFGSGLREEDEQKSFRERRGLQPTRHHDGRSKDRRQSNATLPWKRREESGSTPQWAGFPGQKELF